MYDEKDLKEKHDQLLKDFKDLQKIHLETLITRMENERQLKLILLLKNQLIELLKKQQQSLDI